jgi:uncharacterized protein (TIGR03083 family)
MDTLQSREQISATFKETMARFAALVRPLTAEQLATASRCEGWTVGDVAGHYVGSIAEIAAGDLDGQGTPPVTKRQVEARRGYTGAHLADELDTAAVALGGFDGSLGRGVEALLYDGAVHADDIDTALELGHHPTADELVASVSHVAHHLDREGWGPATLALDGMPEVAIGEGGPRITGHPGYFILAATGRGNPSDFGLDDTVNIYR